MSALPPGWTTLVARLDSVGDVLLAGPAIRAVAHHRGDVVLLCGPSGAAAANLLPGVAQLIVWRAPWIDPEPDPVRPAHVDELIAAVTDAGVDEAVILTSFHQSALPLALLLRLAGVRRITAISEDYPGSLLDVRHRVDDLEDVPEAERALSIAAAAGYGLPPGDDGRLALVRPLPNVDDLLGDHRGTGYVVVHPGASVPARSWPPERCREAVRELRGRSWPVVVTGTPAERELTAYVATSTTALNLGGRTSLAELAAVLEPAAAVVVANTGPAHLAAAVGTPVVSLFAPTVPAARWAPYGVPHVLLGDQLAPCRDSRARTCPIPGHPCLAAVTGAEAADALEKLVGVAP